MTVTLLRNPLADRLHAGGLGLALIDRHAQGVEVAGTGARCVWVGNDWESMLSAARQHAAWLRKLALA